MNKITKLYYSYLTISMTVLVHSIGFCYTFLYIGGNVYLNQ